MTEDEKKKIIRLEQLEEFRSNVESEYRLVPINIASLTPSSTFPKNAILGINGVIYHSTQATSNLPVTLQTQNGAFVTHSVNGNIAFVVTSTTINPGWEVWTDAAIEYWINQLAARATALENADVAQAARITAIETTLQSLPTSITYNGVQYSTTSLLTEVAKLMVKTLVTQS